MRISDWSSDVCSSDLGAVVADKQVQARAGEEGDLGKATQTPELKPGQAHAGSAGAQQNARSGPGVVVPRETSPDHSRSGITTWRQRSFEASRTTAEELASRSAIPPFPSRSAARSSSPQLMLNPTARSSTLVPSSTLSVASFCMGFSAF